MSEITAPNILIPVKILRAYRKDPETLSRLLFAALDTLEGATVTIENVAESFVVEQITSVAEAGLKSYAERSEHAKIAAKARWANHRKDEPKTIAEPPNLAPIDVPKPPKNLEWEFQLREYTLYTILAECNELGKTYASRTFNNLLQTKDFDAVLEEVRAFHSELAQGEIPRNRGAALNARLQRLPNKGEVKARVEPMPAQVEAAAQGGAAQAQGEPVMVAQEEAYDPKTDESFQALRQVARDKKLL